MDVSDIIAMECTGIQGTSVGNRHVRLSAPEIQIFSHKLDNPQFYSIVVTQYSDQVHSKFHIYSPSVATEHCHLIYNYRCLVGASATYSWTMLKNHHNYVPGYHQIDDSHSTNLMVLHYQICNSQDQR